MQTIRVGYLCGLIVFCLFTAVSSAQTPADFHVVFDGIVMHYFPQANEWPNARAVILHGTKKMPHRQVLVTPKDIDVAALQTATGHKVTCDAQNCRVTLNGFDVRIGNEKGDPSPGSLNHPPGETFDSLTPHLQCATKGTVNASVADQLPSGPIAGFFELLSGRLTACRFGAPAFFYPDNDQEGDRLFADKVMLDGAIEPNSTAVIQIRSSITWPKWAVVKHLKKEPLLLRVENHGVPGASGVLKPTNRHFILHAKVIVPKGKFPSICPVNPGDNDDPACNLGYQHHPTLGTPACPLKDTGIICPKTDMNAFAEERHRLEVMAGCANTQWP
jgi:hypothetical protein